MATVLNTAYVNVEPKTDRFQPILRQKLARIDARADGDRIGQTLGTAMSGAAASNMAGGVSRGLAQLPNLLQGSAVAAGAAIGVIMAPALGAALTGGILLGIGGGVLAAGIMAAANSPQVKAAFKSFGDRAKAAFADFGKPFEGPIIRAADTFADALERMAPTLKAMGASMAPIIDKLAPALASMAEKALPGIQRAMEASKPLFEAVAAAAPKLGEAISKFFDNISKGGPGAQKFIEDLFNFLIWIIPKIGSFLGWLSAEYLRMRDKIAIYLRAIKAAWEAISGWFTGTLLPVLRAALAVLTARFNATRSAIVAAWNGLRNGISAGWGFIRDRIFNPLRTFITQTLPGAFRAGVAGIARAWASVQEAARAPVNFVIRWVINRGIIGTFNKVSGMFGGPKLGTVPEIRGPSTSQGYGTSGKRNGDGEGIGDGPGDILKFLSGPAKFISNRVPIASIARRFGNNPLAQTLAGMGRKLVGSAVEKLKELLSFSEFGGGGSVSTGGLRTGILSVLGALRGAFGSVPIISGLRPGAVTLSGRQSYHALGRAIDIAPVFGWAQFLSNTFGPRLKELITPWHQFNWLNGGRHRYTGAVWNQHNFPGGNAHIHAAMDDGGLRVLRPGYNVVPNFTGRNEPIVGAPDGAMRIHPQDLNALARMIERRPVHIQLRDGTALTADLIYRGN